MIIMVTRSLHVLAISWRAALATSAMPTAARPVHPRVKVEILGYCNQHGGPQLACAGRQLARRADDERDTYRSQACEIDPLGF